MNFLKDGLSISEAKVSGLMLAFFVTLGFALWQVVTGIDISPNLLLLLAYEIGAVTGINIADKFGKPKQKETEESYNYNNYDDNIGG